PPMIAIRAFSSTVATLANPRSPVADRDVGEPQPTARARRLTLRQRLDIDEQRLALGVGQRQCVGARRGEPDEALDVQILHLPKLGPLDRAEERAEAFRRIALVRVAGAVLAVEHP